jgi:hypothetical protein
MGEGIYDQNTIWTKDELEIIIQGLIESTKLELDRKGYFYNADDVAYFFKQDSISEELLETSIKLAEKFGRSLSRKNSLLKLFVQKYMTFGDYQGHSIGTIRAAMLLTPPAQS